jgi:LuxR family maltose regulon positive regulatory protein
MATALYLSPNTVKTHLRNLYRKLGVDNRADAVRAARGLGITPDLTP